jgi:hypothetical protein
MALPAWHNDGWEAEPSDLDRLLEDERMVPTDLLQRTRCTPGGIHHLGLILATPGGHSSYRVKFSHTPGAIHHIGLNLAKEISLLLELGNKATAYPPTKISKI